MPIYKKTIGKHQEITHLHFGFGDIHMTKAKTNPDAAFNLLLLYESIPLPIGTVLDAPDNILTTDMISEKIQLVFKFENPESIAALIHSLIEMQQSMFNHQQKTKA